MAITNDDKDELRYLIQQEIGKAFKVGLHAAMDYPIQIGDVHDNDKQLEREKRKATIREIGTAVGKALEGLKVEADARVVEKTDPARADVIRRLG